MTSPQERDRIIAELRAYLEGEEDVRMAFLFGSWAKEQETIESDLDVAVYLRTSCPAEEWEGGFSNPDKEDEIWARIERIAGREADLIVLNRAPATVADSALRGISLAVKDRRLFLNFLLRITSEASDFRDWMDEFWRLKEARRHAHTAGRS